jgi:hypothetical protein
MYITILTAAVQYTRKYLGDCGNTVTVILLRSAQLFLLFGIKNAIPALRIVLPNANADLQYSNVSLFQLYCILSTTFFRTYCFSLLPT